MLKGNWRPADQRNLLHQKKAAERQYHPLRNHQQSTSFSFDFPSSRDDIPLPDASEDTAYPIQIFPHLSKKHIFTLVALWLVSRAGRCFAEPINNSNLALSRHVPSTYQTSQDANPPIASQTSTSSSSSTHAQQQPQLNRLLMAIEKTGMEFDKELGATIEKFQVDSLNPEEVAKGFEKISKIAFGTAEINTRVSMNMETLSVTFFNRYLNKVKNVKEFRRLVYCRPDTYSFLKEFLRIYFPQHLPPENFAHSSECSVTPKRQQPETPPKDQSSDANLLLLLEKEIEKLNGDSNLAKNYQPAITLDETDETIQKLKPRKIAEIFEPVMKQLNSAPGYQHWPKDSPDYIKMNRLDTFCRNFFSLYLKNLKNGQELSQLIHPDADRIFAFFNLRCFLMHYYPEYNAFKNLQRCKNKDYNNYLNFQKASSQPESTNDKIKTQDKKTISPTATPSKPAVKQQETINVTSVPSTVAPTSPETSLQKKQEASQKSDTSSAPASTPKINMSTSPKTEEPPVSAPIHTPEQKNETNTSLLTTASFQANTHAGFFERAYHHVENYWTTTITAIGSFVVGIPAVFFCCCSERRKKQTSVNCASTEAKTEASTQSKSPASTTSHINTSQPATARHQKQKPAKQLKRKKLATSIPPTVASTSSEVHLQKTQTDVPPRIEKKQEASQKFNTSSAPEVNMTASLKTQEPSKSAPISISEQKITPLSQSCSVKTDHPFLREYSLLPREEQQAFMRLYKGLKQDEKNGQPHMLTLKIAATIGEIQQITKCTLSQLIPEDNGLESFTLFPPASTMSSSSSSCVPT